MAAAPCQNAEAPSSVRLAVDLSPSLLVRELRRVLCEQQRAAVSSVVRKADDSSNFGPKTGLAPSDKLLFHKSLFLLQKQKCPQTGLRAPKETSDRVRVPRSSESALRGSEGEYRQVPPEAHLRHGNSAAKSLSGNCDANCFHQVAAD
jgi:hypothetical protein